WRRDPDGEPRLSRRPPQRPRGRTRRRASRDAGPGGGWSSACSGLGCGGGTPSPARAGEAGSGPPGPSSRGPLPDAPTPSDSRGAVARGGPRGRGRGRGPRWVARDRWLAPLVLTKDQLAPLAITSPTAPYAGDGERIRARTPSFHPRDRLGVRPV